MERARSGGRRVQDRIEPVGRTLGTPAEWLGVFMDFTVGTGIVLWHLLLAASADRARTSHPGSPTPAPGSGS
jgi:hypothetical protein